MGTASPSINEDRTWRRTPAFPQPMWMRQEWGKNALGLEATNLWGRLVMAARPSEIWLVQRVCLCIRVGDRRRFLSWSLRACLKSWCFYWPAWDHCILNTITKFFWTCWDHSPANDAHIPRRPGFSVKFAEHIMERCITEFLCRFMKNSEWFLKHLCLD